MSTPLGAFLIKTYDKELGIGTLRYSVKNTKAQIDFNDNFLVHYSTGALNILGQFTARLNKY